MRFDKKVAALRDEIAAYNFESSRGHNRLLSLLVAKLDEAQGLAILAGLTGNGGNLTVVDRAEFIERFAPEAVADDSTDRTVAQNV